MHRPQPSRWKSVWPFLAILVIGPLLGWGASALLTMRDTSTAGQSSASVSTAQSASSSAAQSDQTAMAQSESTAAATDTTQSESTSADTAQSSQDENTIVDHNVKISVLNGTGTNGLAAQKVSELADAGFPGASAANAEGWVTQVSTVYYEDPNLKASAEAVGEALGITNVQSTTGLGAPDVVVILR